MAKLMAELRWGLAPRTVAKKLEERVTQRLQSRLATARDATEEQRLRQAVAQEIQAIHTSYTLFDGKRGPWDKGFLRGVFQHGRNESMLTNREPGSRNFYFFIGGKLWKVYVMLEPLVFPEGNFAAFVSNLEGRLGAARLMEGETSPGEHRRWAQWQDAKTTMRAIDETQHRGYYCLLLEDRVVSLELARRR